MAGDLAVAETAITVFDRDDYDLTVTALNDLGAKKEELIPEFEELQALFTPKMAVYLADQAKNGATSELTVGVSLDVSSFNFDRLIANFDAKQPYATSVCRDLWDKYSDDQHDRFGVLGAAMLLNDTTNPFDHTKPANDYDEAGLVHVSKNFTEQRKAVETERKQAAKAGVELDLISVSQYVVTQAKRRQAGLPLLDKSTFTRFVQYPEKKIDGDSYVPYANVSGGDQLYLDGTVVGDAWYDRGVRRVVRVTEP